MPELTEAGKRQLRHRMQFMERDELKDILQDRCGIQVYDGGEGSIYEREEKPKLAESIIQSVEDGDIEFDDIPRSGHWTESEFDTDEIWED